MTDVTPAWLPLRFRDLDAYGHVYHAEYLTLLDDARTQWFTQLGLSGDGDYVLARMEIDWVSPLGPADRSVRVDFAVEAVGTKSLTLAETMYADDGRAVARSRSVTVRWDRAAAASLPLTPADRRILEELRATEGRP
ncbi:acyl-CoA thioesterase [Nocardioides sp.]|uniref:acyl-CoA thioesterase n=1 Tax=Nocardioides sp. TaxID=35761 RepID=UPI003D0CCE7B